MGGVLNIASDATGGSNAPSALSFYKPRNLPGSPVGVYILDGTFASEEVVNLVNPSLPLTKVGNPVTTGFGVTVSYPNGYDTGILETDAMTVLVVAKPIIATPGGVLIHAGPLSGAASPNNLCLFMDGTPPSVRFGGKNGAGTFLQIPLSPSSTGGTPDPTQWHGMCGTIDASGIDVMWARGGSNYTYTSSSFSGRTLSGQTLRIGGTVAGNAAYGTPMSASVVVIWTSKLDATGRANAFTSIREYLALGSITTV